MDFEFVLDENYLAFFILNTKMYNESKEMENIKNKLYLDNDLGYKKILEELLLDSSIYLKDNNIKLLIENFITTDKFKEIYKLHSNESKELVAIKILKNIININDSDLEELKDDLWYKYKDGYWKLLNMNAYNPSIFMLDEDVIKTINSFKETDEFKILYDETRVYYQKVKKDWEGNKSKINNYLKNILKMNINIRPIVYISHPNTYKGFSFDNNKIAWGHYKGLEDPNYNLTYLVHEGLHSLLPFDKEETEMQSNIKHTIIEFVSDYELYSWLKGESTLNEGHPYLNEYRKFIYPYWLMYIGLNSGQIKERLVKDSVNSNELRNIEQIDILNMNIQDFIQFCTEKYLINQNDLTDKK